MFKIVKAGQGVYGGNPQDKDILKGPDHVINFYDICYIQTPSYIIKSMGELKKFIRKSMRDT